MEKVAAFFAFIVLISACNMNMSCIDGAGKQESKSFDLEEIEGIELGVPAHIEIQQGPQSISFKAYPNYWEQLQLNVKRGILEIESNRCFSDKIEATITMPNINQLEINGSGKIVSSNFSSEDLELKINGSGDMDLNTAAKEIDANINGSGNIVLQGSAQDLKLEVNGSGDFRALDMDILNAEVEISGSGDAELNVNNSLDVNIVGSGDVSYTGQPNIKTKITGSGNVIPKN